MSSRTGRRAFGPGRVRAAARGDAGTSAVELVLVTPLLVALVFGLIQTALVWNARHTVSAAAQYGARLARTSTASSPSVTATSASAAFDGPSGDVTAGSTDGTTDGSADASGTDGMLSGHVRAGTLAYLRQIGGRALTDPTVVITSDGPDVTVTVSGTTVGVLPGSTVRVSSSSRTPLEGFRP